MAHDELLGARFLLPDVIRTYHEAAMQISSNACTFSGVRGTITWGRWIGLAYEWMSAVSMPHRFRMSNLVNLFIRQMLSRWTHYTAAIIRKCSRV